MASSFAAADALSSAAVSRIMGERLRFLPRKNSDGYTSGTIDDPDREPVDFIGTLSGAIGRQNSSGDRGSNFTNNATTRDRTVTADLRDWPEGATKGDRIQALELPGQPVYELVEKPLFDGMNRMIGALVRA